MEKVLAWAFGVLGFAVAVVGTFLFFKDGGLLAALYDRDAVLQLHADRDMILKAWESDIEVASRSAIPASDAKPKAGVLETVKDAVVEKLPQPSEALDMAKDGAKQIRDNVAGK